MDLKCQSLNLGPGLGPLNVFEKINLSLVVCSLETAHPSSLAAEQMVRANGTVGAYGVCLPRILLA